MKTYAQGFHEGVRAALQLVELEASTLASLRREAARRDPQGAHFTQEEIGVNELAARIRAIRAPEVFDNAY